MNSPLSSNICQKLPKAGSLRAAEHSERDEAVVSMTTFLALISVCVGTEAGSGVQTVSCCEGLRRKEDLGKWIALTGLPFWIVALRGSLQRPFGGTIRSFASRDKLLAFLGELRVTPFSHCPLSC